MLTKIKKIIIRTCALVTCAGLAAGPGLFPVEALAATRTFVVNSPGDYESVPPLINGDTLIINTAQPPAAEKILEVSGTNITITGTGALIQGLAINVNTADARIVLDNISFTPSTRKPAVTFNRGGTLDIRNGCEISGNSDLTGQNTYMQPGSGPDAVVNLSGDLRIVGDARGSSLIKGGTGGAGITNPDGAVTISQNITVVGGSGGDNFPGSGGVGITAASLTLNGSVLIRGGDGTRGSGGNGVTVSGNIITLSKTEIIGGDGSLDGNNNGGTAISCGGDIISSGRLVASGGEGSGKGGDGISARNVSLLDVSRITGGMGQTGGHGIVVEQRATYSEDSAVTGGGNGGLEIYNSKLRNMETYSVVFEPAGGTMLTPSSYKVIAPSGSAVFGALPTKITRPGYIFVEWGRAQLGGGIFLSDSPVTSDMTVSARWIVGDDIYGLPENMPIRISDGTTVTLPKADVDTGFYTVTLPSGGGTASIPMMLLPYAKNMVNVYSSFYIQSDIGGVVVPVDEVLESEEYRSIAAEYVAQPGELDLSVRISGSPATCEIYISRASNSEKLGELKNLESLFAPFKAEPSEAFTDVPASHWAKKYIDYSAQKGFVSGVGDGRYDPERSVTRAEFVQMIVNAVAPTELFAGAPFDDVNSTDWFYESVNSAKAAGLLQRFGDKSFYPNRPITREEMAGILSFALGYKKIPVTLMYVDLNQTFDDAFQIDPLYRNDVQHVYQAKIMSGVGGGSFDPKGATTRAQAATVLYNLAEIIDAQR